MLEIECMTDEKMTVTEAEERKAKFEEAGATITLK